MKVMEFVEKYNKNQRINIASELEVKQYIGIGQKRQLAELVLENCTSAIDGEIHVDLIDRYILFTIAVIGVHTNLEFSDGENEEHSSIDDYDMLCEAGLLVKIIDTFKEDYASCMEILNMATDNIMQDNMTFEKKFYNFLDEIQNTITIAVGQLTEKLNIDSLNDQSLDLNNLSQLLTLMKNNE